MASLSSMWSRFQRMALFEHASSFSSRDGTPPLPAIRPVMHDGNRQQIVLWRPAATLFAPRKWHFWNTSAPTRSRINTQHFHLIFRFSAFSYCFKFLYHFACRKKKTANQTLYVKFKVGCFTGFDKRSMTISCYHQESECSMRFSLFSYYWCCHR